jgi:fumarylacetoacetase
MQATINRTHDPRLRSWVESANDPNTDFPIQNLPFGVYKRNDDFPQIGVAIGDQVVNIGAAFNMRLFDGIAAEAAKRCATTSLLSFMSLGAAHWSALRNQLSNVLRAESESYRADKSIAQKLLIPMSDVEMQKPGYISDFSDFYASIHHATNTGKLRRPDQPLLPNYKYVPIGYHGRASSIVAGGTPIMRPRGQIKPDGADAPSYEPTRCLDFELELGAFVAKRNDAGRPISIFTAEDYLFGVCLVNDWSARDIQKWEAQPLGPFLAKSFATSISAWITTLEALAPFRCAAHARESGDPTPLPYLMDEVDQRSGGIDITLEAHLLTPQMRAQHLAPHRLTRTSTQHLYWTLAQLLTHQTSNGCNMRPGDLIASGTASGPTDDARACLLEITQDGKMPIQLPNGETRTYLLDGDEIILNGYCARGDYRRIGLGECRGVITPTIE